MTDGLLDRLLALGPREQRAAAVEAVALELGVEQVVLMVEDPALGVLLPAPGCAQTLHGGAAWRRFVAACRTAHRHTAAVDLPRGRERRAISLRRGALAFIAIGGVPQADALATVERVMPMLNAVLVAEQAALLDAAQAKAARDAAVSAQTLVGALEAARADAARLNLQLREADQRKDEFLAMLAHELRNPLAPLVMSLELLQRPQCTAELRERQLAMMARQVRQMSRLVEDLLDVSRVSRGHVELRREALAIDRLVADAVEASRPLIHARRHRLHIERASEPLTVLGDPARLTQVLTNLLHNAAKYTDPGGALWLTTVRDGGDVVLRLRDSGIGIAPEMLGRIFELFTQVPVSSDRALGGLGIGLTLVRTLVELHGGRVSAESAGIGRGSTFTVRLPMSEPALLPSPAAPAPAAAGGSLRALVVDDNQDAADSLAEILRLQGHHVVTAYHGQTALQLAGDLDADLILLDLGLPDLDGCEVALRMRRIVRPGTRLVALTGYGADDDRRRTREAGFDAHLVKPVLTETLDALLRDVLAHRGRATGTTSAAPSGPAVL